MLSLAGCTSFVFASGPPPEGMADPKIDCTGALPALIDTAYAGFGIAASVVNGTGCTGMLCEEVRDPFWVTLGLSAISAVYGAVEFRRCRAAEDRQQALLDAAEAAKQRSPADLARDRRDRAAQRRRRLRDFARDAMEKAATAARAGDCATVVKLSANAHELDADFHATVFVHDVAIARCLAQ